LHLKIAHSKEHQLQRPLPQLYRQQPGKIALNLSLRNLRPLRSKVSELSQCRLPTATTTPLRRQFLRCLIGFFVIASRWLPETPPLSSGPRELGKQAFGQGSLCKAESGHLEHLQAFHFVQRSTSSFEHMDWKHQQKCRTLRISTGSQDAWKEATWCATLSHHCLKPTSIVKEPDSASLHNINGADPKKVPGPWPSNHEDFWCGQLQTIRTTLSTCRRL